VTADDKLTGMDKGDRRFIEELCTATWEALYRFIYYKVQNREEAEDITQETYVRTITYLQTHNIAENQIPGFMKTVAMNILRDRWRQQKRRGLPLNIEEINPIEGAESDDQMAIIERLQIEDALNRLSKDYRAVLELRILKGYSVLETAKRLKKTEAAVRTSQYRALQALAQIMDNTI